MAERFFAWRGALPGACLIFLLWMRTHSASPALPAGLLLAAAGWALRLAAGLYIHGKTNATAHSADFLAGTGIYAYIRHPLYLGNILICEGIILYANCLNAAFHIALIILIALHYHLLALSEETYLREKFGQAYIAYESRTPRWPGLSSLRNRTRWSVVSSPADVFRLQARNLAVTAGAVLLVGLFSP